MPQANTFTSLKDKDISSLLIPFIAAIFILCTYLFSGIYYGWVDDVLMEQTFRGMFTSVPIADTFLYFRGLGHIFVALYKHFPLIPWYGTTFLIIAWLCCIFIFAILHKVAKKSQYSIYTLMLVYLIAYCAFMYDAVMLLNFTKLSLLLCSSSLLYFSILYLESGAILSIANFLVLFVSGIAFLVRPETNILSVIPCCGLLICHVLYFSPENKLKTSLLAITLFTMPLITLWADNNIWASAEKKEFQKKWRDIHSLLDENNINEQVAIKALKTPEDSIKLVALSSWFYYDENKIDTAFLKRIGNSTFTNKSLSFKAATQYYNAAKRYSNAYCPQLNWFNRGLSLLLLFILLSAFVIHRSDRNKAISLLILFAAPIAILLFIAVLYKMEERVYTPYIITLLLSLITFHSFLKHSSTARAIPVLAILAILGIVNVYQSQKISVFKKDELIKKRAILAEINTSFSNRVLVFDYFSRLLVHYTPFTNVYLPKSNTYLVWGENSLQQFTSHRQYLNSVLGGNSFENFINYTLKNSDNTIFIICNYRRDLIQTYSSILYNKPIKFKRKFVSQNKADTLHYSFVWDIINYNYYTISQDSIPTTL